MRAFVPAAAAAALALAAPAALATPGDLSVHGVGHTQAAGNPVVKVKAQTVGTGVTASGVAEIRTDAFTATIDVSCIRQVGDVVLVGGVVSDASNPANVGWGGVVAIRDLGPGHGSHQPDELNFGFEPPPPLTAADCSVDPSTFFPLHPLSAGNFVVG